MPITFPIDIFTHFSEGGAGGLKVVQRDFDITDPRTMNQTYGGEATVSYFGTNLWWGSITVVPLHNALQRPLEAKVRALLRHDARFYVGDVMDDPLTGLGASAPTVGTVSGTDNHLLRIDGLPVNFVVPTGTRLSFSFDNGRRAFHEVSSRATANASGQATVTVFPIVQPGWTAGSAVAFNDQARCKAALIPKSLKPGGAGPDNSQGFTFDWLQTLER